MENRTRRAISDAERKAIFSAWGNVCAYCENNPAEVVDHIIPFSKGGECILENFAASCSRCNLRKTNNSLAEGYIQIILAIAANKVDKIKQTLARAQKVKPVKPAKLIISREQKTKQNFIIASTYGDWTDMHTSILKQLNAVNDAVYTFTIDNEELLEPLYIFNILVKRGNHNFGPFKELTYYPDTKQAELHICAEGIPYLHICAEKRPKAGQIIEI